MSEVCNVKRYKKITLLIFDCMIDLLLCMKPAGLPRNSISGAVFLTLHSIVTIQNVGW
jgi:hypothetical protein